MRLMPVYKHQVPKLKVIFIIAIRMMLFRKHYSFDKVLHLFVGLQASSYYLELLCTEIMYA